VRGSLPGMSVSVARLRNLLFLVSALVIGGCTTPGASSPRESMPANVSIQPSTAATSAAEEQCGTEDVTLAFVLSVAAEERIECFGGHNISFEGYYPEPFGAGGCAGDELAGDGWLSPCHLEGIVVYAVPGDTDGLLIHVHPSLNLQAAAIPTETWISIEGHFDDPAAEHCRKVSDGREVIDPDFVDACRREFAAVVVGPVE
jgi:hypothetical protein